MRTETATAPGAGALIGAGLDGVVDRGVKRFFFLTLLVRIHLIIVMIRWTGLAPWEFEIPFPGAGALIGAGVDGVVDRGVPGLVCPLLHLRLRPVHPPTAQWLQCPADGDALSRSLWLSPYLWGGRLAHDDDEK